MPGKYWRNYADLKNNHGNNGNFLERFRVLDKGPLNDAHPLQIGIKD